LGEKETGGRAALPIFRDVVQGIYTQGLTGTPPAFPEEMEQRITDYVAAAAAENTQDWAALEAVPVLEPAVLPARLMPALAFTPVSVTSRSPLFDPARSERRAKRP